MYVDLDAYDYEALDTSDNSTYSDISSGSKDNSLSFASEQEGDAFVNSLLGLEEPKTSSAASSFGTPSPLRESSFLTTPATARVREATSPAALSSIDPSSPLYINHQFQEQMDKVNDESVLEQEDAFEKLAQISRDFRAAALLYGQIIINERFLPNHKKTIKPEAVGGIAGGDKYIVPNTGILFKFPNDDNGIYGGEEEESMKAASRELTSLVACWRLTHQLPNMSFPLMTNIDFRGFRIIATLLLPIGQNTLCYGSSDAGKTIVKGKDEEVDKLAAKLASALNLRRHTVGTRKDDSKATELDLACDAELHRGKFGRIYIIDVARLMPPEPPEYLKESTQSVQGKSRSEVRRGNSYSRGKLPPPKKGAHLTRLFRPELVLQSPKPLSSDEFSHFARVASEEERRENAEDILKLWSILTEKIIPEFAKDLDDLNEDTILFGDFSTEMTDILQRESEILLPGELQQSNRTSLSPANSYEEDKAFASQPRAFLHSKGLDSLVNNVPLRKFSVAALSLIASRHLHEDSYSSQHSADAEESASQKSLFPRVNSAKLAEKQMLVGSVLVQSMHERGICVRHIGLIRDCCRNPTVRQGLLLEAVSRVIKMRMRAALRHTLQDAQVASSHAFRECLLNQINAIFVSAEASKPNSHATRFWTGNGPDDLKTLLIEKFGHSLLSVEETAAGYDLRHCGPNGKGICLAKLLLRVRQVVHISFHHQIERKLKKAADDGSEQDLSVMSEEFAAYSKASSMECKGNRLFTNPDGPLDILDILADEPSVREIPLVDYSRGSALFVRSRRSRWGSKEHTRLCQEAHRSLLTSVRRGGGGAALCNLGFLLDNGFHDLASASAVYQYAATHLKHPRAYHYLGMKLASRSRSMRPGLDKNELLLKACWAYQEAIKLNPAFKNATKELANFYRCNPRVISGVASDEGFSKCLVQHDKLSKYQKQKLSTQGFNKARDLYDHVLSIDKAHTRSIMNYVRLLINNLNLNKLDVKPKCSDRSSKESRCDSRINHEIDISDHVNRLHRARELVKELRTYEPEHAEVLAFCSEFEIKHYKFGGNNNSVWIGGYERGINDARKCCSIVIDWITSGYGLRSLGWNGTLRMSLVATKLCMCLTAKPRQTDPFSRSLDSRHCLKVTEATEHEFQRTYWELQQTIKDYLAPRVLAEADEVPPMVDDAVVLKHAASYSFRSNDINELKLCVRVLCKMTQQLTARFSSFGGSEGHYMTSQHYEVRKFRELYRDVNAMLHRLMQYCQREKSIPVTGKFVTNFQEDQTAWREELEKMRESLKWGYGLDGEENGSDAKAGTEIQ